MAAGGWSQDALALGDARNEIKKDNSEPGLRGLRNESPKTERAVIKGTAGPHLPPICVTAVHAVGFNYGYFLLS